MNLRRENSKDCNGSTKTMLTMSHAVVTVIASAIKDIMEIIVKRMSIGAIRELRDLMERDQ